MSGLLTALDAFVPLVPATSMLVASVLMRPQRWRAAAGWFALGGAAGALALAALISLAGRPMLERLLGDAIGSERWVWTEHQVQAHGIAILFLLALGPWPVRTAVAVCALAGAPLLEIGAAVLLARLAGFAVLSWLTARAPDRMGRLRPFRRIVALNDAARKAAAPGLEPGAALTPN